MLSQHRLTKPIFTGHVVGRKNTRYSNAKKIMLKKNKYTVVAGKTAAIKAKTISQVVSDLKYFQQEVTRLRLDNELDDAQYSDACEIIGLSRKSLINQGLQLESYFLDQLNGTQNQPDENLCSAA